MPDLWKRLRTALAAAPSDPPPADPDPPTLTFAGEEWEQHETRDCWHRVNGNQQCHSLQLLVEYAYDLGWFRRDKAVHWWWSHNDDCGPTVGGAERSPGTCSGCGLPFKTWMREVPLSADEEAKP